MDRRTACLTVAALVVGSARPARAQTARLARVAWVSMDRANPESPFFVAFGNGMRE